jgi:hypothetical protein
VWPSTRRTTDLWVRLRAEPAGTTASLGYASLRAPSALALWVRLPAQPARTTASIGYASLRAPSALAVAPPAGSARRHHSFARLRLAARAFGACPVGPPAGSARTHHSFARLRLAARAFGACRGSACERASPHLSFTRLRCFAGFLRRTFRLLQAGRGSPCSDIKQRPRSALTTWWRQASVDRRAQRGGAERSSGGSRLSGIRTRKASAPAQPASDRSHVAAEEQGDPRPASSQQANLDSPSEAV